jgi:beta-glucanase (GH16 family)
MVDVTQMGSFYVLKEGENQSINTVLDNYKLVWHDEFDGNDLNLSKWNYRYLGPRKLGYTTKKAIKVSDGTLKNIIYKEDGKYCSGMISTQNSFQTKYGYFEARVKVAHILGPQSAFWLQSPTFGKWIGNPKESGMEIDIMEYVKSNPTYIHFTTHWDGYGDYAKKDSFSYEFPEIQKNEWHIFGLLWEKDSYKFYVDGNLVHEKKAPISQVNEYIVLSAEIGTWGGDIATQKLPAVYEVDYVRVYKKK